MYKLLLIITILTLVTMTSHAQEWYGSGPRWQYGTQETMYVGPLVSGGEGFSIAYGWRNHGGVEIWPRTTFGNQVFIGGMMTNCADCTLAVNGEIMATSVKVQSTIAAHDISIQSEQWADYVLQDGYNLMPLASLDEYIKAHGHLPGIPTTEEVLENGYSLPQMTKALLEKVEELTLHVIELDKENTLLKEQLSALKTEQ